MKLQKRNRTGASALEFALVAPALIILVFGLMEWSRFEMIRQVSSTAAFAAARVGTLPGSTEAEMEQHVDDVLAVYAISNATRVGTITADEASVSISIPMAQNSWFIKKLFGSMTIQRDFTLNF